MSFLVHKILSNRYFKGSFYLTFANIIISFLNYFFNTLSARYLGPADYSEIATLFAYLVILTIPFQVVTPLIIKKLGKATENREKIALRIEAWFVKQIKKYFYLVIPLSLSIIVLPSFTNLKIETSVALVAGILITFLSLIYMAFLQGLHLFLVVSIITVSATLIKFTGSVLVIFFPILSIPLLTITLGLFFSLIIPFIYLRLINRIHKSRISINENHLLTILFRKQTIYTLLSIFGITLLANLDIIFVKKYFSAEQAGLYSAWNLFSKIVLYLIGPIMGLSLIYFSDIKHNKLHRRALYFLVFLFSCLGILVYLLYTLFGQELILILFGSKFLSIGKYLPLAALFGLLYSLITLLNNYLLIKNPKMAILVFILTPIYIGLFYFLGKTISSIVWLNIYYSGLVFITYLMAIILNNKNAVVF